MFHFELHSSLALSCLCKKWTKKAPDLANNMQRVKNITVVHKRLLCQRKRNGICHLSNEPSYFCQRPHHDIINVIIQTNSFFCVYLQNSHCARILIFFQNSYDPGQAEALKIRGRGGALN